MLSALTATALLLLTGPSAGPSQAESEDSARLTPHAQMIDRGVFVFGTHVLDMRRLVEATPLGRRDVDDCSDDSFVCVRGEVFRFAVPRTCSWMQDMARYEHAGIRMRIYKDDSRIRYNFPVYYLLNEEGGTAYEYHPTAGIVTVYHNPDWLTDFTSAIEAGEASQWIRTHARDRRFAVLSNRLLTLDPLARCADGVGPEHRSSYGY